MESIQIMLDDLGRQLAQKALEAAEWKARAIIAEAALAAIKDSQESSSSSSS